VAYIYLPSPTQQVAIVKVVIRKIIIIIIIIKLKVTNYMVHWPISRSLKGNTGKETDVDKSTRLPYESESRPARKEDNREHVSRNIISLLLVEWD
jgi:hypothetical protein